MTNLTIPSMPAFWTVDRLCVSRADVLGALAKWAVRQSPHLVPIGLAHAITQFSEAWPHENYDEMDSDQLSRDIQSTIDKCPAIVAWNSPKKGDHDIVFCSRHTQPDPDYDFIDLSALARNIAHDIIREHQVDRAQEQ